MIFGFFLGNSTTVRTLLGHSKIGPVIYTFYFACYDTQQSPWINLQIYNTIWFESFIRYLLVAKGERWNIVSLLQIESFESLDGFVWSLLMMNGSCKTTTVQVINLCLDLKTELDYNLHNNLRIRHNRKETMSAIIFASFTLIENKLWTTTSHPSSQSA